MFYISSEQWGMVKVSECTSRSEIVGYGVTDTTDNVEEIYTIAQIKKIIADGIKIRGVRGDKINLYTRKCDLNLKLRSFDIDYRSNDIYIDIDIEENIKLMELARSIYGSNIIVDSFFGIQVTLVNDCPEFSSYEDNVNGDRFDYHVFYRTKDSINYFVPYDFSDVEMRRLYSIYNEVREKINSEAEKSGIFTLEGYTFEGRIKDEGDYISCDGYRCRKDKFIESMKYAHRDDVRCRKVDRETDLREWLSCISGQWIVHNIKLCM